MAVALLLIREDRVLAGVAVLVGKHGAQQASRGTGPDGSEPAVVDAEGGWLAVIEQKPQSPFMWADRIPGDHRCWTIRTGVLM